MQADAEAGPSSTRRVASPVHEHPLNGVPGMHSLPNGSPSRKGKRKADSLAATMAGATANCNGICATPAAQTLLAKQAPHLYESLNDHNAGETPLTSSAPSPARSDATTPSVLTEDQDVSDRQEGHGANAAEGKVRRANGFLTPPIPPISSRHKVPPDFRGPVPKVGDPEDFHPVPSVPLLPGSETLGTLPLMFPTNRSGWRYDAAAPASDRLPESVYKTIDILPRGVHWSWQDRSQWCYINSDASIVCADKGFRSARSNIGVREGCWFAEIEVLEPEKIDRGPNDISCKMKDGPHVRVGWGRREAPLNAPVGVDGYSYGFRDTTGDRVSIARPIPYGRPYGAGDVIGIYIKLPPLRKPNPEDPLDPANIRRKRVPIRYKGNLYFESLEYAPTKEMANLMDDSRRGIRKLDANGNISVVQPSDDEVAAARKRRLAPGQVDPEAIKREKLLASLRPLPTLEGSEIGFFVNGQSQGVAFQNLFDYRPLRKSEKADDEKNAKQRNRNNNRTVGLAVDGEDAEITSSASAKALLKSRENHFDDGSTGYFPFVSLFGGARVRINPGPDFKYPPPNDISASLRRALDRDGDPPLEAQSVSGTRTWRPLCERYDEWLKEQWQLDLEDEKREAESAAKRRVQLAKFLAKNPELVLLPSGLIAPRRQGSASPAPDELAKAPTRRTTKPLAMLRKKSKAKASSNKSAQDVAQARSPSDPARLSPLPNRHANGDKASATGTEEPAGKAEDPIFEDDFPLAQNPAREPRTSSGPPEVQSEAEAQPENQPEIQQAVQHSSPDDSHDTSIDPGDAMDVDRTSDQIMHGGKGRLDTPTTSRTASEDAMVNHMHDSAVTSTPSKLYRPTSGIYTPPERPTLKPEEQAVAMKRGFYLPPQHSHCVDGEQQQQLQAQQYHQQQQQKQPQPYHQQHYLLTADHEQSQQYHHHLHQQQLQPEQVNPAQLSPPLQQKARYGHFQEYQHPHQHHHPMIAHTRPTSPCASQAYHPPEPGQGHGLGENGAFGVNCMLNGVWHQNDAIHLVGPPNLFDSRLRVWE
ncbi:hypothetical protein K437DRAFT_258391 [Tilletiaria anomala UBC 951]|uniref:SPRY domain-containing protein n=1 Tax=Tilletiaria anomala (strain ATCC 24038 / CBS 436.72 / UBC 951) TaxID=1037660 RepID=A0A066VI12_TILAU|nr:uncharacterized protein K437DRAFT_258391 [Tilletiaria anomala UBC 951]KDN41151.1 hypothetical protein K437DRAFT_258391 [Tilletiaria anomala UBC 951]